MKSQKPRFRCERNAASVTHAMNGACSRRASTIFKFVSFCTCDPPSGPPYDELNLIVAFVATALETYHKRLGHLLESKGGLASGTPTRSNSHVADDGGVVRRAGCLRSFLIRERSEAPVRHNIPAASRATPAAIPNKIGAMSNVAFAFAETFSPAVSPAIQNETATDAKDEQAEVNSMVNGLIEENPIQFAGFEEVTLHITFEHHCSVDRRAS